MKKVTLFIAAAVFLLALAMTCEAKTLRELRLDTERHLGQDTTAGDKNWGEAELHYWINEGIKFVSSVTLCVIREDTILTKKDTADYALNSDFVRVKSAICVSRSRALSEVSDNFAGKKAGSRLDGPTSYEDLGRVMKKVRLYPTPVGKDSVFVRYYAHGVALTDTTASCDLPDEFQPSVALYAASRAWKRTRTPDLYFDEMMVELKYLVPSIQTKTEPEPPSEQP